MLIISMERYRRLSYARHGARYATLIAIVAAIRRLMLSARATAMLYDARHSIYVY